MRNQQAVIDTGNGTINLRHDVMAEAVTDEMQNCNPNSLKTLTEGNQTLHPKQTTTITALVITTTTIRRYSKLIVAPAFAIAHIDLIYIRMANTTEFPYTIKNHTNSAELQVLKSDETKQIRPVDAAALKRLGDPDDTHMFVHELQKAKRDDRYDE